MKFTDLIGKRFSFYGACNNQFRLGGITWEAIEDEDDGYRSCLDTIKVVRSEEIFYQTPLAEVIVRETDKDVDSCRYHCDDPFDGYELVDVKDGHRWLVFGTNRDDEYYPWFVFSYQPKAITVDFL